jgi:HEAT repeat protein
LATVRSFEYLSPWEVIDSQIRSKNIIQTNHMHSTHSVTRSVILLAASFVMAAGLATAADDAGTSTEREQQLLSVLRSDAPAADKAITCKKLAIDGSSAAVPELAKLLSDPQLSSWARIALEAIPGAEADAALREAADSLQGTLLVGMINSIGVRRDAQAVDALSKRLQDSDAEVASAAAVALGRIGNDDATKSLRDALAAAPAKVRSAIAEGCVLCAERLLFAGKSDAAAEIYDEVRNAEVPMQRIVEATRGAILARNQDGVPLLLETLRSPEKKLFQLALSTAREFPGDQVDGALATELARATPQRAALIIQVMADRPATVQLAAVLDAASKGDKQVRLSAVNALRRVGDDSCLAVLLELAIAEDADLAQAAEQTLAELPGANVDSEIVAMLPKAKGSRYTLLLQLIGQRRIEAVNDVVKALDHPDAAVRGAALVALGETVSLQRLSLLIDQVVAPKYRDDAPIAQQALKTASVRMPERDACAAELALALKQAPAGTKTTLLEILSEVGGSNALQTLAKAAKGADAELQDAGSRLLGKWNSVDAAPVLLDLANTAPSAKYQVRALRGYIGIARKFTMPEPERAEMCRQAMEAAKRTDEKQLVLDVLQLHPSTAGLKLAITAKQDSELKNQATAATLAIAQKLGGSGVDMTALLSSAGLDPVKLEIVKAEYGAGATQTDVTAAIRKQAGNLPVITLPSASYNTAFGGDPVPGKVKRLKIQYRINGKAGEASFAENALIILPLPK